MSPRARGAAALAAALLTITLAPPQAQAAPIELSTTEHALIRFRLPDEAALQRLVQEGADIAARPKTSADGAVLADLVVDEAELTALTRSGATAIQVIHRQSDGARRLAQ